PTRVGQRQTQRRWAKPANGVVTSANAVAGVITLKALRPLFSPPLSRLKVPCRGTLQVPTYCPRQPTASPILLIPYDAPSKARRRRQRRGAAAAAEAEAAAAAAEATMAVEAVAAEEAAAEAVAAEAATVESEAGLEATIKAEEEAVEAAEKAAELEAGLGARISKALGGKIEAGLKGA
nr:hypothetical protein [Tanacetum cinerariifolium]